MGAVIAAALAAGSRPGGAAGAARPRSAGAGIVRDPLAPVPGSSPGRCSGRRRSAAPSKQLVPARRFADLPVPLTVTVVDLDTGELLLFGAGGAGRAAGGRALRHLRAAGVFPAGHAWRAAAAATAGSGARCRSRRPRGWRVETVVAVDVGPGFDLRSAGASPAVASPADGPGPRRGGRDPHGRRYRGAARALAGGRRPAAAGLRAAADRAQRHLPGGAHAPVRRRRAIARRARRWTAGDGLDPYPQGAN